MRNPQPMQPVIRDAHGDLRFRENAIIRYIVDHAAKVVHPGAKAAVEAAGASPQGAAS